MDTIRTYLDNMFVSLPKTVRIMDLKNNILTNMEEKYNELKSQGKSENEAIGIVISEFGNIDELVNELGLNKEENPVYSQAVTRDEVEAYIQAKKSTGIRISIGVFLCFLAPTLLVLWNILSDNGIFHLTRTIGMVFFFIIITIAVEIFIHTGMNFERFKYMEQGVQLPDHMEHELKQQLSKYMTTFNLSILTGVCMILLSPITLFISSTFSGVAGDLGVVFMLIIIAIAVTIFILSGNQKELYERLLKIGDYTPKKKAENKVIGAVAAIIWPLATLAFLIMGLVFHMWYICWIVFPITGILFGMISAAFSILTNKDQA